MISAVAVELDRLAAIATEVPSSETGREDHECPERARGGNHTGD
jgi:hypothetical protein